MDHEIYRTMRTNDSQTKYYDPYFQFKVSLLPISKIRSIVGSWSNNVTGINAAAAAVVSDRNQFIPIPFNNFLNFILKFLQLFVSLSIDNKWVKY